KEKPNIVRRIQHIKVQPARRIRWALRRILALFRQSYTTARHICWAFRRILVLFGLRNIPLLKNLQTLKLFNARLADSQVAPILRFS
ncbi:9704_t:CDS:2, partial [Funneliformis mosseae]